MRFISTKAHGYVDYVVGVLLILAPWILGFANDGAATWTPVIVGAGVIVYSLLTDYELGVVKMIPMPVHLAIDVAGGLFLAVSPWLFNFADYIAWPHVLVGLMDVGVSLMTRMRAYEDEVGTSTTPRV